MRKRRIAEKLHHLTKAQRQTSPNWLWVENLTLRQLVTASPNQLQKVTVTSIKRGVLESISVHIH